MLKVYLSSPFKVLEETRKKFLDSIQSRTNLYVVNAMEYYLAEDVNILAKCKKDVNECQIYVCIIGSTYGSMAKDEQGNLTDKSYTHWEFVTANERKARGEKVERIILLRREVPTDPHLLQWRQEVEQLQLLPKIYTNDDEIPGIILDCLDKYTSKLVEERLQEKEIPEETVYLCDRSEQDSAFFERVNHDPIQLFLLTGHDKDLPHYFIRKKELLFEKDQSQWLDLVIEPTAPTDMSAFASVERKIKAAIQAKLNWKKFKVVDDVSVSGLLDYMDLNKYECLSISWQVEQVYWKNEHFQAFLSFLYNKYNEFNKEHALKKSKDPGNDEENVKCIYFFVILRYVDDPELTEEAFNECIKNISWENNLPKFGKIKKSHIHTWLIENEIEKLEYNCDQLISLYFKDIVSRDLYYREVEGALLQVIKPHKKDYFK
jgi:hypothetical protein